MRSAILLGPSSRCKVGKRLAPQLFVFGQSFAPTNKLPSQEFSNALVNLSSRDIYWHLSLGQLRAT